MHGNHIHEATDGEGPDIAWLPVTVESSGLEGKQPWALECSGDCTVCFLSVGPRLVHGTSGSEDRGISTVDRGQGQNAGASL